MTLKKGQRPRFLNFLKTFLISKLNLVSRTQFSTQKLKDTHKTSQPY